MIYVREQARTMADREARSRVVSRLDRDENYVKSVSDDPLKARYRSGAAVVNATAVSWCRWWVAAVWWCGSEAARVWLQEARTSDFTRERAKNSSNSLSLRQ
jgi:hypothetical protein